MEVEEGYDEESEELFEDEGLVVKVSGVNVGEFVEVGKIFELSVK